MQSPQISRRMLIGGAAASGLASFAPPLRHGLAAPALPERFDVFLRAHQNGDNTLSQFWYKGFVFGCPVAGQSKALLGIQGFSHQRAKMLPDGTMQLALAEVGYYGDPLTGEMADEVTNSLTGKMIRPHHYKSHQENIVAPDGTYSSPVAARMPGTIFSGQLTQPIHAGGYIFFSENLETLVPSSKAGSVARGLTSLANYTTLKSDFDRHGKWVPLSFDYSSIGPWSDWLEMGDIAGVQNMRLAGRKLRPGESLPEPLRSRIVADHPGFIEDPGI